MSERLDDVSRVVVQLARIATALERLADTVDGDDRGRPAVRIVGEIVGGEGDVREPA